MVKENNTFQDFDLCSKTFQNIDKMGYKNPTKIQEEVIPYITESKRDIVATAPTGTGKTGAFGIPIIDKTQENNKTPKTIILTPTRELAVQVTKELKNFSKHKNLRILSVYGGTPINSQIRELKSGVDIVVGTPGRVVDLIKRNILNLRQIENFILDEADEMLNMGFIEDIEFILKSSPQNRRTYLFSATMPKRIRNLSKKYMKNPVEVENKFDNPHKNNLIEQTYHRVKRSEKEDRIIDIITSNNFFYGIVFCKTKVEVDELTKYLRKNKLKANSIHGDISQNKRELILKDFKKLKTNILVATDVAARGIDINNLTHIINHSLPQSNETYVHRVGRTGRAGNKGKAVSLVTTNEAKKLSDIENLIGSKIKREEI